MKLLQKRMSRLAQSDFCMTGTGHRQQRSSREQSSSTPTLQMHTFGAECSSRRWDVVTKAYRKSSLPKALIRSHWPFMSMRDGFITWRGETNKLFRNGERFWILIRTSQLRTHLFGSHT